MYFIGFEKFDTCTSLLRVRVHVHMYMYTYMNYIYMDMYIAG